MPDAELNIQQTFIVTLVIETAKGCKKFTESEFEDLLNNDALDWVPAVDMEGDVTLYVSSVREATDDLDDDEDRDRVGQLLPTEETTQ